MYTNTFTAENYNVRDLIILLTIIIIDNIEQVENYDGHFAS